MHYRRTAPHPGPPPIGWGEGAWLVATHCRATRGAVNAAFRSASERRIMRQRRICCRAPPSLACWRIVPGASQGGARTNQPAHNTRRTVLIRLVVASDLER
jgi:hypothetical protein